ncbi:MAG TPA: shikimate kinase, partial [Gaiellaceae bacterium]|nr:shikimate kinase [Gaiellaceae bacterium]
MAALNALDRHLALIGFMGAGKSTLVAPVAERLGRTGRDLDAEATRLIAAHGLEGFRRIEASIVKQALDRREPAAYAFGGGAVTTEEVRDALAAAAFTVLLDVEVDAAWERVRGSDRPLAQEEGSFRRLFDERQPIYRDVADAVAQDEDGVVLAAAGIHHELGALERLGELVPGDGPVALVADSTVMG